MSDVNSTSKNNIKLIAIGVVLALHGLAGVGLAKMELPELKTLKITPPITVEIIEPIKEIKIEQVADEVIQTPQPIKPITAPKVEKNPDPRPAAAKPKVEPVKEPPQKIKQTTPKTPEPNQSTPQQKTPVTPVTPEPKTPKTPQNPVVSPTPVTTPLPVSVDTSTKTVSVQTNNKTPNNDGDKKPTNDGGGKKPVDNNDGGKQNDGQKTINDGGKQPTGKNPSGSGGGTGNKIGEITISAAKANASWRKQPNFSNVEVGESVKTQTVSFTVQLKIDEKGRITSATGVNTGLGKNVDNQIDKAIRAASFNPFKDEQGNPARGAATLPMSFKIR